MCLRGHVQRRGVWVTPRRSCCCLSSRLLFRVPGSPPQVGGNRWVGSVPCHHPPPRPQQASQSTGMVMASNLGEAEAERDQRTQIGLDVGHAYAQSLTTGSTAVTLEKVRLYLRGRLGRPNPYRVARPFVTIRANSPVPGQPGRTLHVLTSPTIEPIGWWSTDRGAPITSASAPRYRRICAVGVGHLIRRM